MTHAPRSLDSLTSFRWFAASLVFLLHADSQLLPERSSFHDLVAPAASGVSFFFLLSGFVLAWSHQASTTRRVFYGRRIARLYPAYAVMAIVAIPVLALTGELSTVTGLALAAFTLSLLQSWVPSATVTYAGNSVSWSLSTEMFFYACFPLAIRGLARSSTRRLWTFAAIGASVPWWAAVAVAMSGDDATFVVVAYTNPAIRSGEFVLGVCLGLLVRRDTPMPKIGLAWAGVATVIALGVAGRAPSPFQSSAITLVPYALLIVAGAQADIAGRTPRLLSSRRLTTLGAWSYGFYLVHELTLRALRPLVSRDPAVGTAAAIGAYVVCIGLSGLLYQVVERPAERFLRARLAPSPPDVGR